MKEALLKKVEKLIVILICFPMIGFGQDLPYSFSEDAVRTFIDNKTSLDNNEGIYRYQHSNPTVTSQYQFLILKDGYKYNGHIMSASCVGCQRWTRGDVKFEMTEGAVEGLFDVKWKFPKKERRRNSQ